MKKLIIICLLIISANATTVFFSYDGEKIIKVLDLPNEENFQLQSGKYLDIGYRYKQLQIFFLPIWNYDGKWCGYIGSNDTYIDYTKDEIEEFAKEAGLILPKVHYSPMEEYGGKIILGIIIIGYLSYTLLSKKDEEEEV